MNQIASVDCAKKDIESIRDAVTSLASAGNPLIRLTSLGLPPVERPTPSHWEEDCATPNDETFMTASLMIGEIFGYADLQHGRLVQEIFPIRSDADKQVGSGAVKLELHTEDPALKYRADYLGFLCISNIDKIPTIVSVPDLKSLSPETVRVLSTEQFEILSDRPPVQGEKPESLISELLFLDNDLPARMIYDPVYIAYDKMTTSQRNAFSELQELVEASVGDFLLQPGEIGFIDNYRVAHGRPMYQPRYDGTDRWLKRAQISVNFGAHAHLAIGPANVLP